jgi:cytochrome c peroxidase
LLCSSASRSSPAVSEIDAADSACASSSAPHSTTCSSTHHDGYPRGLILAGNKYYVTDPGRALITGQCADIGKVKGPILRGLASRAPYFHNGSAATLMDVVNFYNQRFNLNFTDEQKQDLVNFLNTL